MLLKTIARTEPAASRPTAEGQSARGPNGIFHALWFLAPLLLVTELASASPIGWQLQSPRPTDRDIYDVAFVTPTHGFIVAVNRHLLETTDGGADWSTDIASDFGSYPFYAVVFPDPLHGYVTGNSNDAWRTTDGGATWQQMATLQAGSWDHLDFLDATTGFAGANGACSFTSDGGATWELRSGYPNCPVMYAMDFRDAQVGLVGGEVVLTAEYGIWKTTDGGVTWARKYPSAPNDLMWLSSQVAVADLGTEFLRSTDAGETWTVIGSGIWTGLSKFARAGGDLLVGVSHKGDIWRSADGGATWSFVFDGLGDLPGSWSIFFLDVARGWVAGPHGILLETQDAGLTWSLRNSGSGVQIFELQMLDDRFGLAACHNGYVLRTTDGGSFWETQKLEVTGQIFGRDETLRGVSVVDRSFAVVAGPGGTVFRTTDGGESWTSIGYPLLPGPFWIEDVEFVDHAKGWLVGVDYDLGMDKGIYRTADGGAIWTVAIRDNVGWESVDFVDPDHGWIGTTDRYFVRTTDGGANWIPGLLPAYFAGPVVSDMEFANAQIGWVVGWFGYLAKTTDGGATWGLVDLGTADDNLLDLDVVSATEVWVAGREQGTYRGFLYHSTDGGSTWTKEPMMDYPYIPATVSATLSGAVWAGGYNGLILHKAAGTVGVPPSGKPSTNIVSLWSSPNPFRSSTTLHYRLPQPGQIRLEVFDIHGRKLETLAAGFRNAGDHVSTWQPALVGHENRTPPGIYFSRLYFEPTSPGGMERLAAITKRIVRIP